MTDRQHAEELARVREAYERRAATGFGERYAYYDAANLLAIQERERAMLRVLGRAGKLPLDRSSILEVGCGGGFWLRSFVQWGADPRRVTGVELDAARAAEAKRTSSPGVGVIQADAARAPFRDAPFDIILQSTVFTSILSGAVRRDLAAELLRLLAPGGLILWYDFRYNNPRNRDVRGITASELRSLFAGCRVDVRSITLAPPIARTLAPLSPAVCRVLSAVPALRTHLVAGISVK